MSLHAQFSVAAGLFSSALGSPAEPAGQFSLGGTDYLGVLSEVRGQYEGLGQGIEVIKELRIVATRDQFSAAPDPSLRPQLTARGSTWVLTSLEQSEIHYMLTAVPLA